MRKCLKRISRSGVGQVNFGPREQEKCPLDRTFGQAIIYDLMLNQVGL